MAPPRPNGVEELQCPPSPSGVEDHYLPICQCTTAGLGNHFMGERRGDHHDQIYSLNGLDHVRCDQIQRLVRGYSLQGQVNASGGPDALQILWKQVAQADVRPHAGQITSNGGAAVAGSNYRNTHFHAFPSKIRFMFSPPRRLPGGTGLVISPDCSTLLSFGIFIPEQETQND